MGGILKKGGSAGPRNAAAALAVAVALAAALAVVSITAGGCGKKGPPVPPPDKPSSVALATGASGA